MNAVMVAKVVRRTTDRRLLKPARAAGAVLVGPVILLVLVATVSDATSSTLQLAAVVAALAVSFQVVYGLLGELSLGHAALFGAGAYTYAALTARGYSIPLSIVAAGVVGLLIGTGVAAVTIRLSEAYFAVATFAIASLLAVAVRASATLGRDEGIIGVPAFRELPWLSHFQTELAYTGVAFLGCLAVFQLFRRSRPGLALETVRTSPWLAASLGIHVAHARIVATALSGLLAGVVGAVFAQQARFVSPDVFGLYYIITPLAVLVVGGIRRTAGALAGIVVVVVLPEMLGFSPINNQIFAAVLLFIVVLLLPRGVIGGIGELWSMLSELIAPGVRGLAATDATPARDRPRLDPIAAAGGTPAIRADGIGVRFGALEAVADVSLNVGAGEILGLIGANGAGKSTFVNAVSGLVPARGRLWIAGREATHWPAHVRARAGLARTFQQVLIAEDLTCRHNLLTAHARGQFWRRRKSDDAIADAAALCGITELLDAPASALSFMHRKLLTIAIALVTDPIAVMLDEATAGLSELERNDIVELVTGIARTTHTAFVVIEHDVEFVARVSDRIAVMDFGRLLVEGPPQTVLADPQVVSAYLGTS